MGTKKEKMDHVKLREPVLTLHTLQGVLADALKREVDSQGESVVRFAETRGVSRPAVHRLLRGGMSLTKPEVALSLARAAHEEELGERMAHLLRQCGNSFTLRYIPFGESVIRLAFDLLEAYRSMQPIPPQVLFAAPFAPNEETVIAVLKGKHEGVERLTDTGVASAISEVLLAEDFSQRVEAAVQARVDPKKHNEKAAERKSEVTNSEAPVPEQHPSLPVLTKATFAYIDEVPSDEELGYMQLKIDEIRVMLERLAQMRDPEARHRVNRMLSGSAYALQRALRLYGYAYPEQFLHLFQSENDIDAALRQKSKPHSQKGRR